MGRELEKPHGVEATSMHKSQFSASLLGDLVLAERLHLEAATVPTAKKIRKGLKVTSEGSKQAGTS